MTWHRVAPQLSSSFFVVCPDLRGYGQSTLPPDAPEHAQSSKRAMADDVVALMRYLGHDRFSVVGHDRGALVAFRTAMDHRRHYYPRRGHQGIGPVAPKKPPVGPSAPIVAYRTATDAPCAASRKP